MIRSLLALALGRSDTGERAGPARGPIGGPADRLGRWGERRAARFLRRLGYRILASNARTVAGEADLVAEAPDRRTIVVVEVKARQAPEGGSGERRPEASITAKKARTLRRVAELLSRANGWADRPLRIDVVAIERRPDGRAEIRHVEGAVGG